MTFHALERPVHGGSLASRTAVSFGNGSRTVRDGRPSRRAQRTEEVGSGGWGVYTALVVDIQCGFNSQTGVSARWMGPLICRITNEKKY